MKYFKNSTRDLTLVILAIFLGITSHLLSIELLNITAKTFADIFLKFLQLMSAPIIFLAIITNFLNISDQQHLKFYGKRVVFYTILTTVAAAFIAYVLFQLLQPVNYNLDPITNNNYQNQISYLDQVIKMFPNNIIGAFAENNVLGVAIIAAIMGMAMMQLPKNQQEHLLPLFSGLFHTFINIARFIILVLPIGIWSFTVLFCQAITDHSIALDGLGKYTAIVLVANLIQGFIVLPVILKYKNISPLKLFQSVYPALTMAFFSKSSSAALPISMDCMIEKHGTQEDLVRFSLPLCTIINMNGCAAFIYTTVIFVAMQSGITFSPFELFFWIFIATIVAIGNASVPMGCYFLSSAILVGMGAPLEFMGLILPLYTFFDMVETALNVWSDCCVTQMVELDSTKFNYE